MVIIFLRYLPSNMSHSGYQVQTLMAILKVKISRHFLPVVCAKNVEHLILKLLESLNQKEPGLKKI